MMPMITVRGVMMVVSTSGVPVVVIPALVVIRVSTMAVSMTRFPMVVIPALVVVRVPTMSVSPALDSLRGRIGRSTVLADGFRGGDVGFELGFEV